MRAAVTTGKIVEFGKDWVGQTVNARYPLQQYLGGSDTYALFLTQLPTGAKTKAVIKLISASVSDPDLLVANWKRSAQLSHPHLMQIFDGGRCWLSGSELLYVVTEFADEDLSQVLPYRALTTAETDAMLRPTLSALAYLHEQGLVHGDLQPANITAVGDQLKLSADTVCAPGTAPGALRLSNYNAPELASGHISPATDMWALGATLVEALTQRAPTTGAPFSVPKPYDTVVSHCLLKDPGKRWMTGDVAAAISPQPPRPTEVPAEQMERAAEIPERDATQPSKKLRPVLLWLVAVVAMIVILLLFKGANRAPAPSAGSDSSSTPPVSTETPSTQPAPSSVQAVPPTQTKAIVRRVLPEASAGALRTIQGHIKVRVRLDVNPSGGVSDAHFTSAGPSKYFSRISMEAARQWRFTPADGTAREWNVLFEFTRRGVEAFPEPARK